MTDSVALIDRTAFLAALSVANRIVAKRSTIPILAHVMVRGDRKGVWITTSDLDTECTIKIPNAKADKPFKFTTGSHHLLEIARKAKSVDFAIHLTDKARFQFGSFNMTVQTLSPADFPVMLCPIEVTAEARFDSATFLNGLERCIPAISNEETRYYLNGILFQARERQFLMTSTDGHRLAQQRMTLPAGMSDLPANCIVPRQLILELAKVLSAKGAPDSFTMSYRKSGTEVRLVFEIENIRYVAKIIDGSFPDYERVVPTSNPLTLKIDREDAIEAINMVCSISSERGRAVRMTMNGRTKFSVSNPDVGTTDMAIDGRLLDDKGKPQQLDIGFNSTYLKSILTEMASDEVTIKLADPGSPALFTGSADHNALYVLMPMRV